MESTTLPHPTLLQPHRPLFCSSPDSPSSFLPQDLCTLLLTLPDMFTLTQPFQLQVLFHSMAFSSNIISLKGLPLTFLLPFICHHRLSLISLLHSPQSLFVLHIYLFTCSVSSPTFIISDLCFCFGFFKDLFVFDLFPILFQHLAQHNVQRMTA